MKDARGFWGIISIVLFLAFYAVPAFSGDLDLAFGEQDTDGAGLIGLGVGFAPDYEGSDEYTAVPLLRFMYQWDNGMSVNLFGNTLRADLIGDKMWSAGPVLRYRAERDDVESDNVEALDKVDAAAELGAFVSVDINNWVFMISGLQDVSDAHKGFLLEAKGAYKRSFNNQTSAIFWAGTTYASDDYMETYFSIDDSNRGTSTLRSFSASGGIKDVEFGAAVMYALNEKWELTYLGRFSNLVDDAADSPVTDDVGVSFQIFGGVVASYRF